MSVEGSRSKLHVYSPRGVHAGLVRCGAVAPPGPPWDRLSEACLKLHAAGGPDDVAVAVVTEALALFEARWAHVEIDGREGEPARQHAAVARRRPRPAGGRGGVVTEVLLDGQGRRIGVLILGDASLDGEASAPLSPFVRAAALAVENAWRRRAADEAVRVREEALALVAHDLRSALCTVALGAGMLRKSLSARGLRHAQDATIAARVERACGNARQILNDLLDATRMDSGTFAVAPSAHPADWLIAEAIDAATMAAAAAGVALQLRPSPSLRVMADPVAVSRLFANLIGNALKFTPSGGAVTVSLERAAGFGRFAVTDTGSGIPDAHLPRLFDRFWRGEPDGRSGHGLGLYIAHGIVEAHGGTITATNDEGNGATFAFTLPLAP